MQWGTFNVYFTSPMGSGTKQTFQMSFGAHAHFGILPILAIVLGFAVDHYQVRGTRRTVVAWFYIAGQWLPPATVLGIAMGYGMVAISAYLWGLLLFVAMATMAWTAYSDA